MPHTSLRKGVSVIKQEPEDCKDVEITESKPSGVVSPNCPDSTSREKEWTKKPFTEGEDILVDHHDGLIYFGIVVEVDKYAGQCLVRFGDCTERWSTFYELRRLGDPECDPIIDEVKEEAEELNEPQPDVKPQKSFLETLHDEWETASHLSAVSEEAFLPEPKAERSKRVARVTPQSRESRDIIPDHVRAARSQLNYTWDSLQWDVPHQRNESEQYCYCGERGDWYKKMLQCKRCFQWFHQKCIRALTFQLMCGDRFFEFTCTLCNGTHEETVKRLDLNWTDAAHLVLFNLILEKNQKFHDLKASIIPLLKKQLAYLKGPDGSNRQLGNRIDSAFIEKILKTNTRFKCGSEQGKDDSHSTYWGLTMMQTPPLPTKYLMFPEHTSSVAKKRLHKESKNGKGKRLCKGAGAQTHLKGKNIPSKTLRLSDLVTCDYMDSDSDASVKSTLDTLIKAPENFRGANNPFRSPRSKCLDGDRTSASTIKRFLSLSEKESPISSGAASTLATDESPSDMIQSVEEMMMDGDMNNGSAGRINNDDVEMVGVPGPSWQDHQFRKPGVKLSDLKIPLSNYFGAQARIARGEKFKVHGKRLTLNGDIAYLMEWTGE